MRRPVHSAGNFPNIGKKFRKFSNVWKLFLLAGLAAGPAAAVDPVRPVLGEAEHAHLRQALDELVMTEADLGFAKDVGEPWFTLPLATHLLNDPLRLPALADAWRVALTAEAPGSRWALARQCLDLPPEPDQATPEPLDGVTPWDFLDPGLVRIINRFAGAMPAVEEAMERAFREVDSESRAYLAASYLAGVLSLEDRPPVRAQLIAAGVAAAIVDRVAIEEQALDPEPAARAWFEAVRAIDLDALLEAGRRFEAAVEDVFQSCRNQDFWPSRTVRVETPWGTLLIGTTRNDRYRDPALLILDPGGDDQYAGDAGHANGLKAQYFSAILDYGGNDRYEGDHLLGPGSALFGLSLIVDDAGDDDYRNQGLGPAGALFGVAGVTDRAGHDRYRGEMLSQGAAVAGLAWLRDEAGSDVYEVGLYGQGFAGVLGVGWLADLNGHDRYYAGGREPDHERHDARFLSLSQGFAIGLRPFLGGGVAVLLDAEGNDVYVADVFGQGASYWYSAGLLLDLDGHDRYQAHQYGQGSGIHLSAGLLADFAGDDVYQGHTLAQGNAHDYGVGMLFDHAGDDTYTATKHAQGRGMNNALGLLLDSAGDDSYFCREPDEGQGIGNPGGKREYGSLGLLLDLAGRDVYSAGVTNGAYSARPDFGIIYDHEP